MNASCVRSIFHTVLMTLALTGFSVASRAQPAYRIAESSGCVVVQWSRTLGELEALSLSTKGTVYGNGRIRTIKLLSAWFAGFLLQSVAPSLMAGAFIGSLGDGSNLNNRDFNPSPIRIRQWRRNGAGHQALYCSRYAQCCGDGPAYRQYCCQDERSTGS